MPSREESLAVLRAHRFMSLATFRKSGEAVATPLTYAEAPDSDNFYMVTGLTTGKVKRLRNNTAVQLAPCDQKGNLLGTPVPGRARILTPEENKTLLKDVKFRAPALVLFAFNIIRRLRWGGNVYLEITVD